MKSLVSALALLALLLPATARAADPPKFDVVAHRIADESLHYFSVDAGGCWDEYEEDYAETDGEDCIAVSLTLTRGDTTIRMPMNYDVGIVDSTFRWTCERTGTWHWTATYRNDSVPDNPNHTDTRSGSITVPRCPKTLPYLGSLEAKRYMRRALKRRFGGSYAHGYGKRLTRCDRRSRTRYRCVASWIIGDVSFQGPVTIWLTRRGFDVWWNYAYKIKAYDEYCLDVTPWRDCVDTYRVR